MKPILSAHDWQLLSAYLDHQLGDKHVARFEARLQMEPALRQGLHSLEQTRLVLRSAPRRKTPRDLRLDPSSAPSRTTPVIFPMLSFASALSAVLLAVLMLSDSPTGLRLQQFEAAADTAPAAVMLEAEMSEEEMAPEEVELPPIIIWAAPSSGPAMGFGGGGGDSSEIPETEGSSAPPAAMPIDEDTQDESLEQPQEEVAPELAAESSPLTVESDEVPQEKEAQDMVTPTGGESLSAQKATQDSTESAREVPKTEQAELDPLELTNSAGEMLPGGPIQFCDCRNSPGV